jgi:transposase, IS6 family
VITVYGNPAYPPAFDALRQEGALSDAWTLRQCKCWDNVVQQEHRCNERRVNPGLEFGTFSTAQRTTHGYEMMHMLRKGQIEGVASEDIPAQDRLMNQLFGLVA